MSKRTLVVLALIALCVGTVALATDAPQVQSWTASPYWTRPTSTASVTNVVGRTAKATDVTPETDILPFTAVTPCRLVDTVHFVGDGPAFGNAETRTYDFSTNTHCTGLPSKVGAWSLNFQFTPVSQYSYMAAFSAGTTYTPGSFSTMLGYVGNWTANAAIVAAGTGTYLGQISVFSQHAAHLIIEVNGYYAEQPVVTKLNNLTGAVGVTGGSGILVTDNGVDTITIEATLPEGPTGPQGIPGTTGPIGPTGAIGPGLSPVTATVTTSESRSNSSYGDLATTGPSVIATITSGNALVILTADLTQGILGTSYMGFAVSGDSTLAADNSRALISVTHTMGSVVLYVSGLTNGTNNVFTAKYRSAGGASTATFANRTITVIPLP